MTQQPTPPAPDEQPMSPADSLALINAQQAARARRKYLSGALLLGIWGLTYLISFGAFYLARGLVADILTGALFIAAVVFSAVFSARMGHGVRGPSQVTGAMYGFSWTLGILALIAINVGLQHQGLTNDQVILLWSGTALLVVGILYLSAGALMRSWPHYTVGAWTMIVGAVSVYVGVPGNFLILSLAGGGGFLAQAGYYAWRAYHPGEPGCAESGAIGFNAPAL